MKVVHTHNREPGPVDLVWDEHHRRVKIRVQGAYHIDLGDLLDALPPTSTSREPTAFLTEGSYVEIDLTEHDAERLRLLRQVLAP